MNKDYYKTLGIDKTSSEAEIKKAYRKKAMEWHPDKHKGDKKAEEKFKEINEAYQVLGDSQKKKQYDTFGSAGNNFSGFSGGQGGFSGFEDLFKNAGGQQSYSSNGFDFGDIFSEMFSGSTKKSTRQNYDNFSKKDHDCSCGHGSCGTKEKPTLDVEKTYEVPIFDMILGTKLAIQTIYNENLKLNIPEGTKPGTKFKIKGKGRTSEGKTGDMYVIVNAKMPSKIPEDVKKLLESIKYRL